ncbi:flippase-like domain-containing protein [Burkholderia plantarii]|uniref:Putative membrane protein HpnL n=1 Tax=Burkholderia plantarii TaxID=41899 RepID=A0A0B6S2B0_BURPL|nr:flippase-like domain-containing protein [Burkholderia plantarii]AJK48544.1 putative membrane protein HpnL [Burkholderia plantarii]
MKKSLGAVAAAIGLAIAIWLVWRDHPATILAQLREAGAGLLLAAAVHLLPMLANAADWRLLIRRAPRPGFGAMLKLVLIRESVNGLLPVARIGGEIVSYRLLRRLRVKPATAIASLVVDMQLTLISQFVFALLALGWLLEHSASDTNRLVGRLAVGIALAAPVLLLFALVQHARPFERATQLLNRVTSGQFVETLGASARVDRFVMLLWRNTGVVVRYLAVWQTLQFLGFSLEIWLALLALGVHAPFADALVIEALIQLVSSLAFLVPGSLGVQEGGFVLIGGLLGLDPPVCLALAGARRLRDLLFYLPGLAVWQLAEHRPGRARGDAHAGTDSGINAATKD